jgi:4-hydroxyproline epimerase
MRIDGPQIHVIDSHAGGEPTRIVIAGGPSLGDGPISERLDRFRTEYDHYRSAIVNEPRGNDAIVGAMLCEPVDPANAAGVIFLIRQKNLWVSSGSGSLPSE